MFVQDIYYKVIKSLRIIKHSRGGELQHHKFINFECLNPDLVIRPGKVDKYDYQVSKKESFTVLFCGSKFDSMITRCSRRQKIMDGPNTYHNN